MHIKQKGNFEMEKTLVEYLLQEGPAAAVLLSVFLFLFFGVRIVNKFLGHSKEENENFLKHSKEESERSERIYDKHCESLDLLADKINGQTTAAVKNSERCKNIGSELEKSKDDLEKVSIDLRESVVRLD